MPPSRNAAASTPPTFWWPSASFSAIDRRNRLRDPDWNYSLHIGIIINGKIIVKISHLEKHKSVSFYLWDCYYLFCG
jgi:hypothetical protein